MLTPPFQRRTSPLFSADGLDDDAANRLIVTASQSPSESARVRALATLGYAGIEPPRDWVSPAATEPLLAGCGL